MRPLPWAGGALGLVALVALGGCGSSTIGRRLSGSFDAPPPTTASGANAAGAPAAASLTPGGAAAPSPTASTSPAATNPTTPSGGAPTASSAKPGESGGETPAIPGAKSVALSPAPSSPLAAPRAGTGAAKGVPPVPYRVTIKLPAADPSAPAEAVTEALRGAGVRFEVETIERLRPGPATAPAVTPAPAVPPAPPAR